MVLARFLRLTLEWIGDMVLGRIKREHSTDKAEDLMTLTPARSVLAINWLKKAQDVTADGGVSYGYYLRGVPFGKTKPGWRSSYVETSAYIAKTFNELSDHTLDLDLESRAIRICDWLISVQNEDRSFGNNIYGDKSGIVFDSGQVLLGLLSTYEKSRNTKYLDASLGVGQWLIETMRDDGAWERHTFNQCLHSYNVRVAWALVLLHRNSGHTRFLDAAINNLEWTLCQQNDLGLFANNAFRPGKAPFTHNIAYAVRGFLEAGILLNESRYLNAAIAAAKQVSNYVKEPGFLAGQISDSGDGVSGFSCLTGNCQMAIIWYKLFDLTQDDFWFEKADLVLRYVLSKQVLKSNNKNIIGAIAGSYPIWGRYAPMAYPNWGAKFLIDAIIAREKLVND